MCKHDARRFLCRRAYLPTTAQMADRQIVPFGQQAVSMFKHAAVQIGAIALFCIKQWWRNISDNHPSSLFQAARSKDLQKLQGLLHRAPRDAAGGAHAAAQQSITALRLLVG